MSYFVLCGRPYVDDITLCRALWQAVQRVTTRGVSCSAIPAPLQSGVAPITHVHLLAVSAGRGYYRYTRPATLRHAGVSGLRAPRLRLLPQQRDTRDREPCVLPHAHG